MPSELTYEVNPKTQFVRFEIFLAEGPDLVRSAMEVLEMLADSEEGDIKSMVESRGGTILRLECDLNPEGDDDFTLPDDEEILQGISNLQYAFETYLLGVRTRLIRRTTTQATRTENGVDIFISHSAKDAGLAKSLVHLIERGVHFKSDSEIRCTSLPGYSLPMGAHTSSTLRSEISRAKCILGLITPNSTASDYVLFELGAAWGMEKLIVPILAGEVDFFQLPGPVREMNAIKANDSGRLWQLVQEIAAKSGHPTRPPAKVQAAVDEFISLSVEYGTM